MTMSYMQSLQPGTMSTELYAITTACNHVYRATCNHYSLQPWLQSYTQSLQSARKAAESCSSCCKFSDALWSARNKTERPLFKTENGATNICPWSSQLTQSSSCAQKNELGWTQIRRMTSQEKKNLSLPKQPYLSNNVRILVCLSTGTKKRTKTPENSLVSIWG